MRILYQVVLWLLRLIAVFSRRSCGLLSGARIRVQRRKLVANIGSQSTIKSGKLGLSRVIIFNKPYRVLSQFSDRDAQVPRSTLADYLDAPSFKAAGRLDYDSEGYCC